MILSKFSFGQYHFGHNTSFINLGVTDTITNSKDIDNFVKIDSLDNDKYFFINKYHDSENLFFIKKIETKWIVFNFEVGAYFGPNSSISEIKKLNNEFLSIQMYKSASGGCSMIYGNLVLLNIDRLNYLTFPNYQLRQCYDINEDEVLVRESECKTTFLLKDNYLKISSTKKPDDGLSCMSKSEFEIKNDKLIKKRYYYFSKSNPVICVQDICTGENFSFLKRDFPNAVIRKIPLYEYGYDSKEMGFEFVKEGQIQFYVVASDNLVTAISFVSPNYDFKGTSTKTTVAEVLEKYPQSKLHIDLINDWEYIYLKSHMVKFIFKTDKNNRIGVYDADPEKGTIKIKRKNAKIDLIKI